MAQGTTQNPNGNIEDYSNEVVINNSYLNQVVLSKCENIKCLYVQINMSDTIIPSGDFVTVASLPVKCYPSRPFASVFTNYDGHTFGLRVTTNGIQIYNPVANQKINGGYTLTYI